MIALLYKIPLLNVLLYVLSTMALLLCVFAWGSIIVLFKKLGWMNFRLESAFPRSFFRVVMNLYALKLHVRGRENYDPKKAYVLISNHQSLFDIPVVWNLYTGPIKMIAKKELFSVPFFGWAAKGVNFIKIDRGNQKSAAQAKIDLSDRLKEGNQIWIAVEGTRSESGELLAFKKGAFRIAKENNVSLLPLVIFDAKDVCRKGSFWVRGGRQIHVEILPEVQPSEFSELSVEAFSNEVRERMLRSLDSF